MSADSEKIKISDKHRKTDLNQTLGALFNQMQAKLMFFLFVLYLILSSDVFMHRVLSKVNGATTYAECPTTNGTLIIGILLVLFLSVINVLNRQGIL